MNEPYSLGLALVDFIPSLAFAIGAYFLIRLVQRECGKPCAYLMIAGCSLVFMAGFLKALWKLLYALNLADIQLLSEAQFVLLAPGFFLMLIATVRFSRMMRHTAVPLAAMAAWKIPLMFVMVVSSLGVYGILTYLCFQRHLRLAAVGFIIAFLGILAMGGMAGGSQTVRMQWIAESINSLAQIGFAVGCYLFNRASTRSMTALPRSSEAA
jgi:hypothetical protein